jgi:hypothetical protein
MKDLPVGSFIISRFQDLSAHPLEFIEVLIRWQISKLIPLTRTKLVCYSLGSLSIVVHARKAFPHSMHIDH